jgi:hypothetical protein
MSLAAILLAVMVSGCVVSAPAPVARVEFRPPPIPVARYEVPPPPPSPRHVWQPGGWHWNGREYVWLPGHYIVRLETYHRWVPGHWEQGAWIGGHWV